MQCVQCNKTIFQRAANNKYCSVECRSAYRRATLGTCRIDECEQKAVVIGERLCTFHYRRFVAGLDLINERSIRTRGTGTFDKRGYIVIRVGGVHKFEHRLVVEKAMGKPLPDYAIVHHLNEKKWDNRNNNLVVCPNDDYHKLLHRRTRELGIIFE